MAPSVPPECNEFVNSLRTSSGFTSWFDVVCPEVGSFDDLLPDD